MLVCGGKDLAAHASFDPVYKRAKKFIHNRPVGPAVLSPILISGLVGALIESTLPQSFFVNGSMNQLRPLIVGVEVEASIQVVDVTHCGVDGVVADDMSTDDSDNDSGNDNDSGSGNADAMDNVNERYSGYELLLETQVKRVNDGAIVSNGTQRIWLPDYGNL
jgi:hypothetical protein